MDATDDEEVTYVGFWLDGDYVGADTSEPFSFSWNSRHVFNGDVEVVAKAYDVDEQSDQVTVTYHVNNPLFSPTYFFDFEDATHFSDHWQIIDASGPGTWQLSTYRLHRGLYSVYCGQASTHQYGAYEYDWLIMPTVDLSGVLDPFLYFHHWWNTEANYDYVKVYVTTDLDTWYFLGQYHGTGAWQRAIYDLSGYNVPVKVAFLLQSDPLVVGEGWYLDDVMVRPFPEIDSLTPSRAYLGQTVTIAGQSFGDGFYTGALALSGHGDVSASEITSWSDEEIVLDVPGDTTTGNIELWGQDTGAELTIVLPPPTLESLTQH